jgi:hypothetical protein
VDGVLHAALIQAKSDGADKGRRRKAAGAAQRLGWGTVETRGTVKRIAAAVAGVACQARELAPANTANWHRRKLRQRGAAEITGGRKNSTTQCIHGTSKHAGYGAPTRSLGWRNLERQ